jgi:hypothetical protein
MASSSPEKITQGSYFEAFFDFVAALEAHSPAFFSVEI